MPCRAICSWTFCSLVGAYLDLALAYLLLCGSTLAYLVAKFLAFFGLSLPCSCDGLFGRPHPAGTRCLQGLLVDCPVAKVASVQRSSRSQFPFDSILNERSENSKFFDVKLVRDGDNGGAAPVTVAAGSGRRLEMAKEGEESCGSVSNAEKPRNLIGFRSVGESCGERRLGFSGQEVVVGKRARSVLRRRRRLAVAAADRRKPELLSCSDGISGECSAPPVEIVSDDLVGVASSMAGFDSALDSGNAAEKGDRHETEENEEDLVRKLKWSLEEERAAYAAVYVELEKERSAAATAADEAMAMILRLQEEKAAIEMEARQYQRMNEEKSAYDEEEMEILKEIILMREREKHVLEKEVEMYRQMMVSDERFRGNLEGNMHDMVLPMVQKVENSALPLDDSVQMLEQIDGSPGKNKAKSCIKKDWMDNGPSVTSGLRNGSLSLNSANGLGLANHLGEMQADSIEKHHTELLDSGDDCSQDCQEKGVLTPYIFLSSAESQRSSYGESSQVIDGDEGKRERNIVLGASIDVFCRENVGDVDQSCNDSAHSEIDSSIYDVHVIDDKIKSGSVGDERKSDLEDVSNVDRNVCSTAKSSLISDADCSNFDSFTRCRELEENIQRSCSESAIGIQMADSWPVKTSLGLRRSSMSVVDSEIVKLETEVELLRKRLRIVQQGRQKLSLPVDNREKENFQLQLLEEIACQLREIRRITEPGKDVRRASLPPLSSQAESKKRRCRSVSWEVQDST